MRNLAEDRSRPRLRQFARRERTAGIARLIVVWATCAWSIDAWGNQLQDRIVGLYEHVPPVNATLQVAKEQNLYKIELNGGVLQDEYSRIAADCSIVARGILVQDRICAIFMLVDDGASDYPIGEPDEQNRFVCIKFSDGSAFVESADSIGYCGLNTILVGQYDRALPRE